MLSGERRWVRHMTVGDAAVQPVVVSGGGMLSRAIKATIKNDPSCGSGMSTIDDGGSIVFCVCGSQCWLGADSVTSMLTMRIRWNLETIGRRVIIARYDISATVHIPSRNPPGRLKTINHVRHLHWMGWFEFRGSGWNDYISINKNKNMT